MFSDAIEAWSEDRLKDELMARGIDVAKLKDREQLVNTAMGL